jgi:hypothetical protein
VTHATPPTLDTDDSVTLIEHSEFDRVHDTPLQATVDVLLPRACVKVGFGLGKVEGIYAAVQVSILY